MRRGYEELHRRKLRRDYGLAFPFLLFRRALSEGPQLITRQGKEGVVMISGEQYERLVGKAHQPKNLLQFFRESPLVGVDLDLERYKDEGRDIEL